MSDVAPKMDPNREYNEINTYVVSWGLLFVVVFALAIGFLALKIGQTIGAETPVSVLAMGMGMMFKRKDAFAETVQMQSISSASTNILGAAIFILPAFYILNMQDMVSWCEMIIPMILGGAMAAVTAPLMNGGGAPWPLYFAGAFMAVIMWMVKVPPLAFALGIYLPIEINTLILIGGIISYLVSHSTKSPLLSEMRVSRGNTIASGLVAGGAMGSLISAILKIAGVDVYQSAWANSAGGTYVGVLMYVALCVFLGGFALKVAKSDYDEGEIEEHSRIE